MVSWEDANDLTVTINETLSPKLKKEILAVLQERNTLLHDAVQQYLELNQ